MTQPDKIDPTAVLIEDLSRRIAAAHSEAASWKTRALIAEAAVAQLKATIETSAEDDGNLAEVIEMMPSEDDE